MRREHDQLRGCRGGRVVMWINDPTLSDPREADVVRPRVCPKPLPTVAGGCEYDREASRVFLTCLVHFEQAFVYLGPALHMRRNRV